MDSSDIMAGARYVMHGNFKVFARAVLTLNRIGEELYLEPTSEGFSMKSLNCSKSAYVTFIFSSSFFSECDIGRIKDNENNLCRISMKCALSAFKCVKNHEKTVLSCRMFINPKSNAMLIQLIHIYVK
ncbi:unnamed protein product [Dracunculus medinensis]|uniref:Uncharacterized protein n=1 Tax=Dracunculus medinensis TaxID=318479 RepID=A0A158Q4Y9_DRAME|nr:unnamed protein product [Dracunculus medinensis]